MFYDPHPRDRVAQRPKFAEDFCGLVHGGGSLEATGNVRATAVSILALESNVEA